MGFLDWLFRGRGHGVDELARRLKTDADVLARIEPRYQEFSIPKRSGGKRTIEAPSAELKSVQRQVLRRVLRRLSVHPAATGFERGCSIVRNARAHQGRAVVMRFDVKDFFASTTAKRLRRCFRRVGWNRPATELLLRLCTHKGRLPQGAPTSPRLSNLVNFRLDARLAGMASRLGAAYTRYADDVTLSFDHEDHAKIHYMQRFMRDVLSSEGYALHQRKKLSVRRRHDRQMVTGLVVNHRVNLPRRVRRWLRAVEYRSRTARPASLDSHEPLSARKKPTLTPQQLDGWRALQAMIARQSAEP
jgi:hypothetical protein